jgi:hypothetical protein
MKRLIVAAALLACACAPPANTATNTEAASTAEPSLAPVTLPVSDQAGNRMEALTQNDDRSCSADNAWCVIGADGAALSVAHGVQTLPLGEGVAWPMVIRIGGDSAIVGVVSNENQMYSGGGGNAAHVKLYEIANGAAREVAMLPLSGALDIRACFSEADQRRRADACSDQYNFVSRISLDEGVSSGAPRIILETDAGTFPGHVSRSQDSTEKPPLQQSDLVWWHDDTCSYRRVFNRGADGLYTPDQPLPACSDYLEP